MNRHQRRAAEKLGTAPANQISHALSSDAERTLKFDPKGVYEIDAANIRASSLLNPYDMTLQFRSGMRFEIGRFSQSVLSRCRVIASSQEDVPLRIGAFCEAAFQSVIMVGGDHRNDSIWNYTCAGNSRPFYDLMEREDQLLTQVRKARSITIGDNVVISTSATILGGSEIGTGSVIGANTLVNKVCEDYGIYVGTPARRAKDRFAPERAKLHQIANIPNIHSHHVPRLPRLLRDLEFGVISPEEYRTSVSFIEKRPRLFIEARTKDGTPELQRITGYALGDTPITDPEAVDYLNTYFAQVWAPGEKVMWTPDIFHTLGLC